MENLPDKIRNRGGEGAIVKSVAYLDDTFAVWSTLHKETLRDLLWPWCESQSIRIPTSKQSGPGLIRKGGKAA